MCSLQVLTFILVVVGALQTDILTLITEPARTSGAPDPGGYPVNLVDPDTAGSNVSVSGRI